MKTMYSQNFEDLIFLEKKRKKKKVRVFIHQLEVGDLKDMISQQTIRQMRKIT